MAKEPTSPLTKQNASAANRSNKATKTTATAVTARHSSRLARLGHIITGAWAVMAAMATGANLGLVNLMEYQAQSLFFELRGQVAHPDNIVILAIDETSLLQEQTYRTDPQKYAYLEPLQSWPWKRAAYARAIDRVMAAGAKSVAVDLVFDLPSSYGLEDDQELEVVLQRYAGRVTLAALYDDVETPQGSITQLTQPERLFWTKPVSIGTVNYPLEMNNKIHRLASELPNPLAQNGDDTSTLALPTFDEAALRAAGVSYPQQGTHINFYGPAGTFEQIPFWFVLDPDNWNSFLEGGAYLKDKIVIIGSTSKLRQDFHAAPFSKTWLYPEPMSGVEIHANAIATLLEGKAIAPAFPNPLLRGLLVLLGVGGTAVLVAKAQRGLIRFGCAVAGAIAWGAISYFGFVYGKLIFPTAVPIVAIALGGVSYLATGAARDSLKKRQLKDIIKSHASSPIVQEIISQHDDLQDLIQERERATLGKIIGSHYRIIKVLGAGGFSETYIAEDTQRPGNPLCVVKQLRPANSNPKHLELARRLFKLEGETLQRLGSHNQIPQLFAYFEEDEEFYLVQELIVGHPLNQELQSRRPLPENAVIKLLRELLQTLEFIHHHNVIHRDIKPSNIIRRESDGKLVLIDFGAVKEVSTQMLEQQGQTGFTIGIGTQGYAPSEQCAGRPQYSSDIYAVGMTGIKAISGLSPHELQLDPKTGEFIWAEQVQVSSELAAILTKMVRYDFTQRYQSASQALKAVEQLLTSTESLTLDHESSRTLLAEDLDTPTAHWASASSEEMRSPDDAVTEE